MATLSKNDKLLAVGYKSDMTLAELGDRIVDLIYQAELKYNKNIEKEQKENKKREKLKKVDCNSSKYKVLLRLINQILSKLNKPNIDKLEDFKYIDRDGLIKEEIEVTMQEMEPEIYKYFDKTKTRWYFRNTTQNYILSFLRLACYDVGLLFNTTKKNITKNGNVKTHYFYSID